MNKHDNPGRRPSNAPAAGSPDPELLPEELLWAAGGHASDLVLTALADGQQSIVPMPVRSHVERCTACMGHLGNTALLSLHVDRQLAVRAEYDRARAVARRPLPRRAIALGLMVAVAGLVPSIFDGSREATAHALTTDVPLFVRGLGTLVRRLDDPGSPAGLIVTYAAAAMLVVMGLALVRVLPKLQKESSR
jgi:hypothetical protein